MRSNKELSKEIREKIKAKGIKRNTYSICVRDVGYSTSISIEVKDITVNPAIFTKILDEYSYIRRDEHTYEILSGCNTFTRVQYDYDTLKAASEKYNAVAMEVMRTAPKEHNQKIAIYKEHELYFAKNDGFVYVLSNKEGERSTQFRRHVAETEHELATALAIFNGIGTFNF